MGALEAIERQVVIGDWYRRHPRSGTWFRGGGIDGDPLGRSAGEVLANAVLTADPFYVAPNICDLIQANFEALPMLPVLATDPPTANGFAWLGRVTFSAAYGLQDIMLPVHAVSWAMTDAHVIASFWGPAQIQDQEPAEMLLSIVVGVGELPEFDSVGATPFTWLRCFWAFTKQRIVSVAHRQVPHTFKGSAVQKPAEVVRVVQLRARETHREGDVVEGTDVEWSCRWIVRGHWHTVTCGKKDEEQRKELRWYAPYVKGPEDKPLKKPQTTLFAVVR